MKLSEQERKMIRYIRRYPDWVNSINTITTVRGISYDGDKVQTSPQDEMLEMAIKIEAYQERIEAVELALQRVYPKDTMRNKARRAYCYGVRCMTNYEYYSTRKALARELINVFGWDKEGDRK